MNSSWVGSGIARARSVTNITAPFRTVTSSRSWPCAAMVSWYSSAIRAPSCAVRAWIWSCDSNTDLMSPGYSSPVCAATCTACHVTDRISHRFAAKHQHAVATAGDQPLAAQGRPDGHATLAAPGGDQGVDTANLLVGQAAGTAGQQPAADDPAPDRLGEHPQSTGVKAFAGGRHVQCALGERVEHLGVLAQRRRGPRQRFGHPAAEDI